MTKKHRKPRSKARIVRRCLMTATLGMLFVALPAQGQDTSAFVWDNATELSYVSTGGNASSSTLGLKGALGGTGGANTFTLDFGGVRASTDFTTRTAVGSATDFRVSESVRSDLTAESYFARGRFDRTVGAVFLFSGVGWDRNTFSGIQNRYALVAGVGRSLVQGDAGHLKADVGATYTIQKDVDPAPGADDAFGGIRFTLDAARKLSETATFGSKLVVDDNIEDTEDLRADWVNSLSVAISEGLALKTSLQLLFDNRPSLIPVPLSAQGGAPTGTTVLTPGNDLDRVFTLTLVIKL